MQENQPANMHNNRPETSSSALPVVAPSTLGQQHSGDTHADVLANNSSHPVTTVRKLKKYISKSLGSFDFCLYTLFVAAAAYASYFYLNEYYGAGEHTDRYFFFSLPLISEAGFWFSYILTRRLYRDDSKSGDIHRNLLSIPCVAATTIGVWAFLPKGPRLEEGLLIFASIWAYYVIRDRFLKQWWMELFEIPVAICVASFAVYVMLLAGPKDPHHWSFYIGPIRSVLQGGVLLWDTPSQYGFLLILSGAVLSWLTSADPTLSISLIMLALQLTSAALTFCLIRFSLGFSTLCSALVATTIFVLIAGGMEEYLGVFACPGSSAVRFGPAFIALLVFSSAVHKKSRVTLAGSAVLVATSCLWSAESCLYTMASITTYLFLTLCRKPRWSFFTSPACQVFALGTALAAGFLILYSAWTGRELDPLSFYEYARAFSTNWFTLPIALDETTALFVFVLGAAYYLARLQFSREQKDPCQGALWFTYAFCVSTYFVARSHPYNTLNIFPWVVASMVAIRFEDATSRKAQRGIIFAIGVWGLVSFISLYNEPNATTIARRLAARETMRLPPLTKIPPEVALAAKAAAGTDRFTIPHNSVYEFSAQLNNVDNTLPINPIALFLILDTNRRMVYLDRMMERVPESFLLFPTEVSERVHYALDPSNNHIELKEIQYQFSNDWHLVQVKRIPQ